MCFLGEGEPIARGGGGGHERFGSVESETRGGGSRHMIWRLTTGAARTTMTATPRTAARCGASTSTLTRTRYDSRKQRERVRKGSRSTRATSRPREGLFAGFDSFLTPAYGSITLVCLSLCSQVRALNEEVPGSCKDLFRSWEDRLDLTKVCLPTDQFSHPILAAGTVL